MSIGFRSWIDRGLIASAHILMTSRSTESIGLLLNCCQRSKDVCFSFSWISMCARVMNVSVSFPSNRTWAFFGGLSPRPSRQGVAPGGPAPYLA